MRYRRRMRVLGSLAMLAGSFAGVNLTPPGVGAAPPGGGCNSVCWVQKQPANSPSPRYAAAMAGGGGTADATLFGGTTTSGDVADTWNFNGIDWIPLAASGPSARHGATMTAYKGDFLMFGDSSAGAYLGDTWYLDRATWTWNRQDVTPSPSPRAGAAIQVYSILGPTGIVLARHAVLFGGRDASGPLNDTWVWDGSSWALRSPPVSPAPRSDAFMSSDSNARGTVLYGGSSTTGTLGDTWTWDGGAWTQRTGGPSSRFGAARQSFQGTLIGGHSGTKVLGDEWSWTGTRWERLGAAGGPSPRYLANGGDHVLFGGRDGQGAPLGDTWLIERYSPPGDG